MSRSIVTLAPRCRYFGRVPLACARARISSRRIAARLRGDIALGIGTAVSELASGLAWRWSACFSWGPESPSRHAPAPKTAAPDTASKHMNLERLFMDSFHLRSALPTAGTPPFGTCASFAPRNRPKNWPLPGGSVQRRIPALHIPMRMLAPPLPESFQALGSSQVGGFAGRRLTGFGISLGGLQVPGVVAWSLKAHRPARRFVWRARTHGSADCPDGLQKTRCVCSRWRAPTLGVRRRSLPPDRNR
jgi:hypothetical protein